MDSLTNNNMSTFSEERGWEYKQITVTRVPGYGFGIAVSGGRDNPHFASGDPSIAVSDVLASGPAERILQVNDRIISVNGISLQNVDYATAVQVLRDSGDTVLLVVKRRTTHQHNHNLSASYGSPLTAFSVNLASQKITLTKNSKKEDFGIVLGCKLFIKEISSKAREQLINSSQYLTEGDFITKINNTNCNDVMSMKEAKKIIDGTKDKLHLTVARDFNVNSNILHQPHNSNSVLGAVNNLYKGDDFLTSSQSYTNQNLYVQPPTRNPNLHSNGFEEKMDPNSGPSSLPDDKTNLTPKGRSRGPLSEANVSHLDKRSALSSYSRLSKMQDEPPRPPPPRVEDYYSTRRQFYYDDPIIQKNKQPISDARFITFHKEGSVGIRLTGGNFVGIFVTAVQPGSPASLQGLQPGDKILKVNDMDMNGVTREEAVLYLLSLQDRIELIVQFCKDEYDNIVASQKGDSFYIKTHFHYENPAKGEMTFRSGDIFHVVDTLYNGVVGCWQVYRIGRNNQEVQKGVIPNKARAEELATAQFNATKKEMSANETRGNFFKRRRSSNRRSKSLGKEHWDDILFSDTVSKFPAYERVVLKHPGFTRPVILFGPIADIAREKLLKDFQDKFISPQLDSSNEDTKSTKISSSIIRLSSIRDVIATGKHALLDITPNAVERLNYAQLYPIVIFFKADTKIIIKQLRQGLPKSAHKSSKKLSEQCQKLDNVWSHIFCATITLNDNTDNWYRKIREIIDKQQTGAIWMSENKPEESLSDDFLFPMSSLRLSYASSPESDLEHSPGPSMSAGYAGLGNGNGARLTKSSSDPSVVMPDNTTADILPPYQPTYESRYGFSNQTKTDFQTSLTNTVKKESNYLPQNTLSIQDIPNTVDPHNPYSKNGYTPCNSQDYQKQEYSKSDLLNDPRNDYNKSITHKRQISDLPDNFNHSKAPSMNDQTNKEGNYTDAPDLPPRVDRAVKPMILHTTNKNSNSRSAHERLFGIKTNHQSENNDQGIDNQNFNNQVSSLERNQNSKSDSLSSYDSFNNPNNKTSNSRIGPNAHDDLKTTLSKIEPNIQNSPLKYNPRWDHKHDRVNSKLDLKYAVQSSANHEGVDSFPSNSRECEKEISSINMTSLERGRQDILRSPKQITPSKPHVETKTDYGKYSRNNSSTQEYIRSSQQDLSQSLLSVPQTSPYRNSPRKNNLNQNGSENIQMHHMNQTNGLNNSYKPIPPPKPKNYKPPYKNQGNYGSNTEGLMQPPLTYQHGKSHSNPVQEHSSPAMQNSYNYYYNVPQNSIPNSNWQVETAVRYNSNIHNHCDNPLQYESRRHNNISYASRSEITPISQHEGLYNMETNDMVDTRTPERPNIVDLQGSREQRGSAFELYRKPVHHNLR